METQIFSLSKEQSAQLSSFSSHAALNRYCAANFQKIGSGSGRNVYLINDHYVLKVAKNEKGLVQNTIECDYYFGMTTIFAKVLNHCNDKKWLIMERGEKIRSKKHFKELAGFDIDKFYQWLTNCMTRRIYSITKEEQDFFDENETATDIFRGCADIGLNTGDFSRISSYGVINGKLKVIDYGTSENVWNEYYKRK